MRMNEVRMSMISMLPSLITATLFASEPPRISRTMKKKFT